MTFLSFLFLRIAIRSAVVFDFLRANLFILKNFKVSMNECLSDTVDVPMLSEDSEIFSDIQGAANPLNENFEMVMGTLGLSERKPVPDPIVFEETDPLGISLMAPPHNGSTAYFGLGNGLGA